MPPIPRVPVASVVWMAVLFGAFGVRLTMLEPDAPGRPVIVAGVWISGIAVFALVESVVLARIALHRARHPSRLIAAVARGADGLLGDGERVEDAIRLVLWGPLRLRAQGLVAVLPRTMATPLGADAPWLAPLLNNNTPQQVVLARTGARLLLCRPDIERKVEIAGHITLDRILFVEFGRLRQRRVERLLIGIGFANGPSIVTEYAPEFGEVIARFFAGLLPPSEGTREE